MIKKLTDEQKASLKECVREWRETALCTESADKESAEGCIRELYSIIQRPEPEFIWRDSPLGCMKVINSLASTNNFVFTNFLGNTDISWIAKLQFCAKLGIKYERGKQDLINLWVKIAKSCHWFWPGDTVCLISDRPEQINIKDHSLHKDEGVALKYRDGFSAWALNGVLVSKEVAETPAREMNSVILLEEKNAEARREIVRKIGIEKICKDLRAKTIDKDGEYELLLLDLHDGRQRPYLKMLNPSVPGIYHVEGVAPHIKKVKEAIEWRNGVPGKPVQLT